MLPELRLSILSQPDDTTCGPTCLHAVYRYFGDEVALDRLIGEIPALEEGGTLAVHLGTHALRRGYRVTLYTFNLQVFDPTWFQAGGPSLRERLAAQVEVRQDPKLRLASQAYLDFIAGGGRLRFEDLTPRLVRHYLKRQVPILTGLSATYLYRTAREFGPAADYDDVRGLPAGHFVILCGYDSDSREVLVADPMRDNPISDRRIYQVGIDRVICAILLGVLTYDANLLILEPGGRRPASG